MRRMVAALLVAAVSISLLACSRAPKGEPYVASLLVGYAQPSMDPWQSIAAAQVDVLAGEPVAVRVISKWTGVPEGTHTAAVVLLDPGGREVARTAPGEDALESGGPYDFNVQDEYLEIATPTTGLYTVAHELDGAEIVRYQVALIVHERPTPANPTAPRS